MKKLIQFGTIVALLFCWGSLWGQQPQNTTSPIYDVNAKYLQGVGIGYRPTKGSGLTLNLAAGTTFCAGTIVAYAGGTLTMTNTATNYVELDASSSCAPSSNTSGFTSTNIPVAKVVASGGAITTITDDRTLFVTPSAGGSGANTALSNLASVSINTSLLAQTGVDLGSTTHPFRNAFLFGGGTYGSTYLELTGTPTGSRVLTLPDATDTLIGKATTDTLTNKTFDTAGTGNSFLIAGTAISAVSGTGAVCLASGSACSPGSGTVSTVGDLTGFFTVATRTTTPAFSLVTHIDLTAAADMKPPGTYVDGDCLTTLGGTLVDSGNPACTGPGIVAGGIIAGNLPTSVAATQAIDVMGTTGHTQLAGYSTGLLFSGPAISMNVATSAGIGRYATLSFYSYGFTGPDTQKFGDGTYLNPSATGWAASQQTISNFFLPPGMSLNGIVDGIPTSLTYYSSAISGALIQPMVSDITTSQAISTTKLFCAGAQQATAPSTVNCNADEQLMAEPIPDSVNATSLCVNTSAAVPAGASFVATVRKGTGANPFSTMADTAISVSIPASQGSGRYCSTGSVSFAGGNIYSVSVISPGGSTSAVNSIVVEFTPTATNMRGFLVFPKGNKTLTASTTVYVPMDFNSNPGAELTMRTPYPRADKLQNYRCYIKTAPATNTTTFKLDKNGSTIGTPNVSALTSSGNDVVLSDTSTTLTMAALDGIDEEIAPGAGVVVSTPACTVGVYAP